MQRKSDNDENNELGEITGERQELVEISPEPANSVAEATRPVPVAASTTPTTFAPPLAPVVLVLLVFQNCTSVLLAHFVQGPSRRRFSSAVAVSMAELIKCLVCAVLALYFELSASSSSSSSTLSSSSFGAFKRFIDTICNRTCWLMLVPAVIYAIENNLFYTALSNLEPQTFQVLYQSKLLVTAVMWVIIFKTSLSQRKWLALFLLFCGVVLAEVHRSSSSSRKSMKGGAIAAADDSAEQQQLRDAVHAHSNSAKGLFAVVVCSLCSAFAAVYFEKVVKQAAAQQQHEEAERGEEEGEQATQAAPPPLLCPLLIRNVQLAGFSFLINAAGFVLFSDGGNSRAPFANFDVSVWLLVVIQALGGLLVSAAIAFASSIWKGIASSAAIVVNSVVGIMFLGTQPSVLFAIGASLVVFSTVLYSVST